jgi:hypothetical protein
MTSVRSVTRARPGSHRRPGARRPVRRRRPARRRSSLVAQLRRGLRKSPWWPAVLIAVAVIVGVAWQGQKPPPPPAAAGCTLTGTPYILTGEQVANAETIADVAHQRGLPDRAVVIALATAMQESRLRNLPNGDRDSVGLFQQRPSQGWGSYEQVHDPAYAAGKFYDHLVGIPNWQTGDLTTIAQAVQRSAFPLAYAKHEAFATALTKAMAHGASGITCR